MVVRGGVPRQSPGGADAVCLGNTFKLLDLWFDSKHSDQPFSVSDKLAQAEKVMAGLKVPSFISRKPAKGAELRSWLLYYSPVVMKDLLPDQHFSHWCCYVIGISLLLGHSISPAQLKLASQLLNLLAIFDRIEVGVDKSPSHEASGHHGGEIRTVVGGFMLWFRKHEPPCTRPHPRDRQCSQSGLVHLLRIAPNVYLPDEARQGDRGETDHQRNGRELPGPARSHPLWRKIRAPRVGFI